MNMTTHPVLQHNRKKIRTLNSVYKFNTSFIRKKREHPGLPRCFKTTRTGMRIFIRPVDIADELLLKDFFQGLSIISLYRRFISLRKSVTDEFLQKTKAVDFRKEIILLVTIQHREQEKVVGIGQYHMNSETTAAEVGLVVSDNYQNKGIGGELLGYLVQLAKKQGLQGFTGIVLMDNWPMLHLCESIGFASVEKIIRMGMYELKMTFS